MGELFRDAVTVYQGTCYIVTSIDNEGQLLELEPAVYGALRGKVRLFDPEFALHMPEFQEFTPPPFLPGESASDYFERARRLEKEFQESDGGGAFRVEVPQRVHCEVTDLVEWFYCRHCGVFSKVDFLLQRNANFLSDRKCVCGASPMVQAPIYLRRLDDDASTVATQGGQLVQPLRNTLCRQHGAQRVWHRLSSVNFRQPIGGLRLWCPQCHGSPVGGRSINRKGHRAEVPGASIRRAINFGHAECADRRSDLVSAWTGASEYVKAFEYVETMKVFQVTLGYYYDSGQKQAFDLAIGRTFPTSGLRFELNPVVYAAARAAVESVLGEYSDDLEQLCHDLDAPELNPVENAQIRRWVLHSFGHALLMFLPYVTGLDYGKFGYSYNLDANEVVVYDNEHGGIGGCEILSRDRDALGDYLRLTGERITNCDCRNRCRRCLVSSACGEVNNALNRHLLGPLFGVTTDCV